MLLFRFNEEITLSTDRCPYRGKNEDYCKYFLTALFHEVGSYEDIDSVQAPPPVNINASTSLISNHAMAMQLDRTMNVLRYGMVMDVREFHLGFLKLMVLVKILVRIMLILFLKNLIKNLVSVPDCQDLLTPDLYCAVDEDTELHLGAAVEGQVGLLSSQGDKVVDTEKQL